MPTGQFWVNNHAHVIEAMKPYTNFFIYLLLRKMNISSFVTGAVQPKINQENLKKITIPKLDIKIVERLADSLGKFWEKIKENNYQINNLIQTRDLLLPKLMNDEIFLKENN